MRGAAVQEQRELRRERGGQGELRGEGVPLEGLGAVVQAVVVEAELAEGDEGLVATAGTGGGGRSSAIFYQGAQVVDDGLGAGGIDGLVVQDGLVRVRIAGRAVVLAVGEVRWWM